jgi:sialate O-acetylesterase
MVLQRDTPASIYGTSSAGDNITVEINGVLETTTTTLANGAWTAVLKTRPASSTPVNITVSSATANSAPTILQNVLFGDVWICGGQSNMCVGLGQDINATAECAAADAFPHIRLMTFTANKPWAVASKATACTGTGFSTFSAVCWYFGKNLYESLGGGGEEHWCRRVVSD